MTQSKRNNIILFLFLSLSSVLLPLATSLSTTTTTTPTTSSSSSSLSNSNIISVWDNILPPQTCETLHQHAKTLGLGHYIFTRPLLSSSSSSSPIEVVLDEILSQLNISSKYVEYWTRREWRHIEAHADVDENLAKHQDNTKKEGGEADDEEEKVEFRYPKKGHVLYLKIGSNVHGPTCLFPHVSTGGDLLPSSSSSSEKKDKVELVTVPAVRGRLLQFEGNMLHAVPRPTDLWIIPFVKGSPNFEPEEEWGRSVILFNVWNDEAPMDVPFDEHEHDDNNNMENNVECIPFAEWKQTFILSPSSSSSSTTTSHRKACNNDDNTEVCNETQEENEKKKDVQNENIKTKIWLLGNARRRNHLYRNVQLFAPSKGLIEDALYQVKDVKRVTLFGRQQ